MEKKRNSFITKYNSSGSFSFIKCITKIKQSKRFYILLSLINLLLSLGCIATYIYMTYKPHDILRHNAFFVFNFVCRIYFFLDFLCDIILMTIEKNFHILDLFIDVISIVPFIIMRFIVGMKFSLTNNTDMIMSSLICFRINRIGKFSFLFKSDINKELYNSGCLVLMLLIISSILLNVIENTQTIGNYWLFVERDCFDSLNCSGTNDNFHTTLFFVMTTLSTIGYYSSITSIIGRLMTIVLIVIQYAYISTICANLMSLITSKSVYARTSYNEVENTDFILIGGNISMGSIDVLLQEYFHPDHGGNQKHCLVLMPQQPDPFMKKLMQKYQNKLFYFEGDCMKLNDLERCLFHRAKMIMLLCNKQSDDSAAEDAKTIIQAMGIKKFLAQIKENEKNNEQDKFTTQGLTQFSNKSRELLINKITYNTEQENSVDASRLIIQLMRPESEYHFELSVAKNSRKDQILCIDQLKLSLLAKSCLCPGIITLLSNLITTNCNVNDDKVVSKIMKHNQWMIDYAKGKDYEIYKIPLESLRGVNFTDIVHRIYKKNNGAILFALNIESKKTKNSIVLLSPTGFTLPVNDNTISLYGYLLATDQDHANQVLLSIQNEKHFSRQSSELADLIFATNQNKKENEDEDAIETDRRDAYMSDKLILAQAYHVTSEHIPKENAIMNSLQNKLFIKKGHIIICGICQNLLDFIKPLRAKHIPKGDCPTIVILSKELPDDKVWNSLAYLDELFIVQGDPLNQRDLYRAGIETASKVVILAPTLGEISTFSKKKEDDGSARKLTSEEGDLLDSKTIFKYNLITKIRNDIYIVVELINPNNVSFLNKENRKNSDEYVFINAGMDISQTASFASGEVYYSNMMDNLIVQTFYNPNLLDVLKKLIIGEKEDGSKKNELKDYLSVSSGNLYLIDMPNYDSLGIDTYSDLTYGMLFEKLLLKKKMITIGVYKYFSSVEKVQEIERESEFAHPDKKGNSFTSSSKNMNLSTASSDSGFYYVVTSPDKKFKLDSNDKLFILTTTYPLNDKPITMVGEIEHYDTAGPRKRNNREIRKEMDIEGRNKIQKLNTTIGQIKDTLFELRESTKTNGNSKKQISDAVAETIQTLLEKGRNSK